MNSAWRFGPAVWLSLACGMAGAAPALPPFAVGDRLSPADPQAERQVQWGADGGVTLTDVTYATLSGFRPLRLDLYRSAGQVAARPLVLFLHGGGWRLGNPRGGGALVDLPAILAHVAQRGYVVASIEYRLSGEAAYPAQLQDLQAALAFLRANAARLGIDASAVALWGLSAGAHLGALGAVSCGESRPPPAAAQPPAAPCVQAFVGWFGAYDLVRYAAETTTPDLFGALFRCGGQPCASAALMQASPINFVDGKDPPALLIHGTADSNSLASQSSLFAERLRSAGVPADLLLLPDVTHGFIGSSNAQTHAATVQALNATFDFLDRQLRPAGRDAGRH
jgi:acetyl esterase/lipase